MVSLAKILYIILILMFYFNQVDSLLFIIIKIHLNIRLDYTFAL